MNIDSQNAGSVLTDITAMKQVDFEISSRIFDLAVKI